MATAFHPSATDGSVPIPAFNESVPMSSTTDAAFSADDAALLSMPLPEVTRSADDAALLSMPPPEVAQSADDAALLSMPPSEVTESADDAAALTVSATEVNRDDDNLDQLLPHFQSALNLSPSTSLPTASPPLNTPVETKSADNAADLTVAPVEGPGVSDGLGQFSPRVREVLSSMSLASSSIVNPLNAGMAASTANIVQAAMPSRTSGQKTSRRAERVSAPVGMTPRYALPTAASSRRKAETLRALNAGRASLAESQSANGRWLREPTRPRSPNFKIAGRNSSSALAAARHLQKDKEKVVRVRRASVTQAKSPMFLSRGRARRNTVTVSENDPPKFTPNPTPAFLTQRDVLPDIKLNAKTLAAMERRAKPRTSPRPPVPSAAAARQPPPSPTVPRPFSLRGVERHEQYCAAAVALQARQAEEDRERRKFRASPLNEAIMTGPTFVPTPALVPLTEPIDLLPFAAERSERTRAYEARQRERVERLAQEAEEKERARIEEEERRSKEEYNRNRFVAQPVPKSTYVPHPRPRLSSSSFSGSESKSSSRGASSKAASSREDSSRADSSRTGSSEVNSSKTTNSSKMNSSTVGSSKVNSSSDVVSTSTSTSPSGASFPADPAPARHIEFNSPTASDSQSVTAVAPQNSQRDGSATDLSMVANGASNTENSVICETSEPQTPANDTVSYSGQELCTPDAAPRQTVSTSEAKPSTSEAVESPINESQSGWVQRMKKSLSPLLGGSSSSS